MRAAGSCSTPPEVGRNLAVTPASLKSLLSLFSRGGGNSWASEALSFTVLSVPTIGQHTFFTYVNLLRVHQDPTHTGAGLFLSVLFQGAGREPCAGAEGSQAAPAPPSIPRACLLFSAGKAGGSTGQVMMPESTLMCHVY